MAEREEELKSLLMRVKEKTEKAGLQPKVRKKKKTKIMTSSPITLWQIEGKKVEAVNILFLGSKITEDGECSHEIKRSCDKPRQCIKKQRHHLANKGPHSQRYGFSSSHVQM